MPVPLARNSKSAFDTVVVITLVLKLMSAKFASVAETLLHFLLAEPKLYAPLMSGSMFWLNGVLKLIVSDASLPKVINDPPIVILPVVVRFWEIVTSLVKLIVPAELTLKSFVFVCNKFPANTWY